MVSKRIIDSRSFNRLDIATNHFHRRIPARSGVTEYGLLLRFQEYKSAFYGADQVFLRIFGYWFATWIRFSNGSDLFQRVQRIRFHRSVRFFWIIGCCYLIRVRLATWIRVCFKEYIGFVFRDRFGFSDIGSLHGSGSKNGSGLFQRVHRIRFHGSVSVFLDHWMLLLNQGKGTVR
jgi:hypothetical protein